MKDFLPIPNADTEIFYKGCKEKKLLFQKCKNCGHVIWPFSFACPICYNIDTEIIESKGYGKIYTFTIYNVAFHKSFKENVPYVVAIVHLQEGPKLITNIVDSSLKDIKCEAKVYVKWEKFGDYFMPKFKLI